MKDAEWIADLLSHGLLAPSFIPSAPQRELRELTRYGTKLVEERAREVNRLQKTLEDTNLKLADVVSDVMGKAAQMILRAVVDGESDPVRLAAFAVGRVRASQEALERALTGKVTAHHRFLLGEHLRQIEYLDEAIRGVTPPPKPKGLLKLVYVLPRYLYRWHLGWLLDHRFLLLTHQGRKTGRIRQTVLEVAHYDAVTRECQVIVFYGEHADWYRNIQAHPALEVQVGRQRYVRQQRELSPEEVLRVLLDYQRRYPWAFRLLPLFGYPYDGSRESVQAIAMALRGVAFRP